MQLLNIWINRNMTELNANHLRQPLICQMRGKVGTITFFFQCGLDYCNWSIVWYKNYITSSRWTHWNGKVSITWPHGILCFFCWTISTNSSATVNSAIKISILRYHNVLTQNISCFEIWREYHGKNFMKTSIRVSRTCVWDSRSSHCIWSSHSESIKECFSPCEIHTFVWEL